MSARSDCNGHAMVETVDVIEGADAPNLITLFMHRLLLELGGQFTFNIDELKPMTENYVGARIAFNQVDGTITLTLRTVMPVNEQSISHQL